MSSKQGKPGVSPAPGGPKPHYALWSQSEIVAGYKAKGKADFFASDTYFLARIAKEVRSILDVGCAAGSLLEVFRQFRYAADYVGIDIAPENIAAAQQLYPDHAFEVADAANYETAQRFDLVYCAGTMFHIPEYQRVITNMLGWSKRYVGFEVKFGPYHDHLADIELSYSKIGEDRAYMIVLNPWKFLGWLTQQPGVGRVQVFGYQTPINSVTVTPPDIKHFVSCCVFIEKGDHLHEVSLDLPFGSLKSAG
jgi:SAM-dependent methyltransferase